MDGLANMGALLPTALAGLPCGIIGFCPMLAVLVPVLRGRRRASIAMGLVSVVVSFTMLSFFTALTSRFLQSEWFLSFVFGEMVGFFLCWIALAVWVRRG